jgi:hypothetical protein
MCAKHSVYAGRVKQRPQPVLARLRPDHFIHFIAAAAINRGPNLLGGMPKHYRLVMFGKPKFLQPVLARGENRQRRLTQPPREGAIVVGRFGETPLAILDWRLKKTPYNIRG